MGFEVALVESVLGNQPMKLSILDDLYAVCRLKSDDELPTWVSKAGFWTITKTQEELSVLCLQSGIPKEVKAETDWKIIRVEGPLDFGLTGVLASIANPLATAKVSIFAVSTFDTDYILVKKEKLETAKLTLAQAGFNF